MRIRLKFTPCCAPLLPFRHFGDMLLLALCHTTAALTELAMETNQDHPRTHPDCSNIFRNSPIGRAREAPSSPILHPRESRTWKILCCIQGFKGKTQTREKTQRTPLNSLLLLLYITITAAQPAAEQLSAEGLISSCPLIAC